MTDKYPMMAITKTSYRYKILKTSGRFTNPTLLAEIDRRRLSKELVSLYLSQGYVEDMVTGKKYWGFLFENDKGGYQLCIPVPHKEMYLNTHIGPQASTRILIDDNKNSADVFNDFWDFLSWLQWKGKIKPSNHSYILNDNSMVNEVCQNIIAFKEIIKYAFLFMTNNEIGYQTTHFIAAELEEDDIKVASLEQLYDGFKNLSDFRMGTAR